MLKLLIYSLAILSVVFELTIQKTPAKTKIINKIATNTFFIIYPFFRSLIIFYFK